MWLQEHEVDFVERDIFAAPLSPEELDILSSGDLRALLATKSPTFRATGKDPESLSQIEIRSLLQENPRMIRRPIVRFDSAIVIGFNQSQLDNAVSG